MTLDLKYYTTKQVAKFLHKDIHTIRRYVREGKFPGTVYFGKQYLIPESSLVDFLHQHCPDRFAERSV